MTKHSVKKRMETDSGKLFLKAGEIARMLGTDRNKVVRLLEGVDFFRTSEDGHKRYFIEDVAEKICELKNL